MTVSVFQGTDELPEDVQRLFDNAEGESMEFGLTWYRNLIKAVYPADSGVRFYVQRRDGLAVAAVAMIVTRRKFGHQAQSLSNYYTALYAPALASGIDAEDLQPIFVAMRREHASLGSLRLAPMDPQSESYRITLSALRLAGMVTFEFFCFGNWYMRIDSSWPAYLKGRSGILRSTVKRMGKKFATDGGSLELIQGGADLERGLAAYQRVYAASWKGAEPYPEFMPGLVRSCAARGWLRLGVAWLKDEPIAAQIWIVAEHKVDIYKLAYHEDYKAYAPGTLLTVMLMQHVFEQDKAKEIDYLIGDDAYKQSWMDQRRERWGLIAYNPRSILGAIGLLREWAGRFIRTLSGKRKNRSLVEHGAT